MRDRRHLVLGLGLTAAALVQLVDTPAAHACGCLSPPAVTEGDFAVNQSAEQIIFEVEPGWVTAHVLIRYAGDPKQFAWIVPVPEVPELSISPSSAFALLDKATAPDVEVGVDDVCPRSAWACHYDYPEDTSGGIGCGGGASHANYGYANDAAGASDGASGGGEPPVTVINEQTVGDYQTVTFRASEAAAATQWLRDNGFIVNPTTSIYMESYVQAGMVFVAAKLVPGAGVSAVKPLRMRYRAAYPTVPLILTAVAAQPHLTVTSFVYANQAFRPMGHPVVTVNGDRLARDPAGRLNYPMVLARTIDEAGGDAFAIEYRGNAPQSTIGTSSCCTGEFDMCHVGNNGQCECPGSSLDLNDCAGTGDLADGITLVNNLSYKYTTLTRITTRISPEEMTFDPTYEPDFTTSGLYGPLRLYGNQASLATCASAVVDQAAYAAAEAREGCAAMYCGPAGQCVTTQAGPACQCNAGSVAQRFIDLDNKPSITCVPATPPADLRAGGDVLPDACAGQSCGNGQCADRNGIAVCVCDAGAAATLGASLAPRCAPVEHVTQTPGAENFSDALRTLAVCAPPPPSCGPYGLLERVGTERPGVACGNTDPAPDQTYPKPSSGGCQEMKNTPPVGFVLGTWFVLAMMLRRRRGARARS